MEPHGDQLPLGSPDTSDGRRLKTLPRWRPDHRVPMEREPGEKVARFRLGSYEFKKKGVSRFELRDTYHLAVALTWPQFLAALLALYRNGRASARDARSARPYARDSGARSSLLRAGRHTVRHALCGCREHDRGRHAGCGFDQNRSVGAGCRRPSGSRLDGAGRRTGIDALARPCASSGGFVPKRCDRLSRDAEIR
jgi:hypothetical protein